MQGLKINNKDIYLLKITFILILLILSFMNLKTIFSYKKVLGVETAKPSAIDYWSKFLTDNPNYIPGLLEINNTTEANKVDPNYRSFDK